MKILRSRDDILEFAAAHARSQACATAIREGRATIGELWGGWSVDVLSKHGRRWELLILADEETRLYRVRSV